MVPIPGCLGEQKAKENNERWKKEAFPKALKAFFFQGTIHFCIVIVLFGVSLFIFWSLTKVANHLIAKFLF